MDSDLHNVDPRDPNVLYPPYYILPENYIFETDTASEDDDDEVYVNNMPLNYRRKSLIILIVI
jgi:hypothetical protein